MTEEKNIMETLYEKIVKNYMMKMDKVTLKT